jgi:hypothetical protein
MRDRARLSSQVFCGIELLVLAFVLALAWKSWSGWPAIPLADPDTWGYLNPALSWLSGTGFVQAGGRDWLYPALVALFLKTTGSFTGIVTWQKCISLLSGMLMAITWRCWTSMLPFHRIVRFAVSLLGGAPDLCAVGESAKRSLPNVHPPRIGTTLLCLRATGLSHGILPVSLAHTETASIPVLWCDGAGVRPRLFPAQAELVSRHRRDLSSRVHRAHRQCGFV